MAQNEKKTNKQSKGYRMGNNFPTKYSTFFHISSTRAKEICDFFLWFLYTYENVKHSRSQEDKISKTINGYTVPQDLNQFVYTSQI